MKYPYAPQGDQRTKKWLYLKEARQMIKYIKDSDVVYDIGANIADHSIYFAMKKNARIIAFEPVPEYFNFAKKNIKYFGCKNIEIFNYGISDKVGIMNIALENEGSSFLKSRKSNRESTKVKVETIDSLVERGIQPPNVIKIDIEGWAEFAFKGMIKTLLKFKPIILLEPHPVFLNIKQLESKFKVLEDIGYRITKTLLNKKREFVLEMKPGKTFKDFKEIFFRQINDEKAWSIRLKYDSSTSKEEIKKLKIEYKNLLSQVKVSLFQRLIWSKLYRFFTFIWLKTK